MSLSSSFSSRPAAACYSEVGQREMSEQTRNLSLAILIWIFAVAAAITLLPVRAPKPNDLGYISLCPFAPWSTLALLLVAGVIAAIRQYLVTRRS
jgi:hypothetical protein